uniref:Actin related protein 1B n=2 Tax=Euarchontoglires TaxID=314146 RepID=A0A5F4W470_CALJA
MCSSSPGLCPLDANSIPHSMYSLPSCQTLPSFARGGGCKTAPSLEPLVYLQMILAGSLASSLAFLGGAARSLHCRAQASSGGACCGAKLCFSLQGSGVIKAGFAGDQIPKYCFPNYVGRPKHMRVMAGALEGDLFIGPKAEEHRGLLTIRYPMEHGVVRDWNDMERIWQYVYSKDQLQTFSEEHPVLLTEAPLNPSKNREKAAEVFFETFNVPALFISMQAVLSLYATGRTTGVVLDSGDGVTHAVPIYEGFAMPHSIMRVDIAGRDVSRFLRLLLRKEGVDFHTSAEFEVVRTIKERACYLSINPQKDEALETEKVQYTLPDGSTLDVGPARFRAPELLFQPDLVGDESEGLHEVLAFAIHKSDMDLRRTLFANIVLSGGSTLFKGFGDRLLSEVKKLAPKDVKIKISAPQERLYSTWIGCPGVGLSTEWSSIPTKRMQPESGAAEPEQRMHSAWSCCVFPFRALHQLASPSPLPLGRKGLMLVIY